MIFSRVLRESNACGLVLLACLAECAMSTELAPAGVAVGGPSRIICRFKMPDWQTWEVRSDGSATRFKETENQGYVRSFTDAGVKTGEYEARFGRRIVLQGSSKIDMRRLVAGRPLSLERELDGDRWLLAAPDLLTAIKHAAAMSKLPNVRAAYPIVRWKAQLSWSYAPRPTDSLFYAQWYLDGRDQNGAITKADLNIRSAWPITRGAGVTLAVVDSGVDTPHVELVDRAAGAPHHNFVNGTSDGLPPAVPQVYSAPWAHGTAVAGLAVASLNVGRMAGAAPEAALASWVIFEPDSNGNEILVDDVTLGDMFQFANDAVAVQNHSWNHPGEGLHPLTAAEQDGVNRAVELGRGGRGVVMVRSAGNERFLGANANDDGYAQDPRIVAVAGVYDDGRAIEFSEPGACLLVAAAAAFRVGDSSTGLLTTDLRGVLGRTQINFLPPNEDMSDYAFNDFGFAGTSAAAPLVAGTVTLMLAANPELTIRDVQQILALSARHFDLADPDLTTNAAGFVVSHNVGFGVPDAGHAVRLAQTWVNRPAATELTRVSTTILPVPDSGLLVEVTDGGVPLGWSPVAGLPGTGPHPDNPTDWLPVRDLGVAAQPIGEDLTGMGALILRGGGPKGLLVDQLQRAADAGAEFGVLYNYPADAGATNGAPGGDDLTPLGGTEFIPMPVIFIGNSDGERLQALVTSSPAARVRMRLNSVQQSFDVQTALVCEHVGVRLRSDHPLRGDLRLTLLSPGGTRSVLQRYNGDLHPGPVDWTYWSTHHLGESSLGTWTLAASDQYAGNVGSILEASLILRGVPISDSDADGLDDTWETSRLGNLDSGPRDDPDDDGYSNAFEQLASRDPAVADFPLAVDLSRWNDTQFRLSWPGRPGTQYEVWSGSEPTNLALQAEVPSRVPETEFFVAGGAAGARFFQVRAVPSVP